MIRIASFVLLCLLPLSVVAQDNKPAPFQIATFELDITCPLGHPLIAGLRQPAKEIVDPLQARGMVFVGAGDPIVICSIDWCEIRNSAYDRWRDALAKAAGTKRERVLVCCLHQHDAPLSDLRAEEMLTKVGLGGEMFDVKYHERCVTRVAAALKRSLKSPQPITHLGLGQAKIEKIASNRRVVCEDGSVTYSRSSASGGNVLYRDAPVGEIDPMLKTISFWNGDRAIAGLSMYATHPMSFYGRGGVTWDFVGMARDLRQRDDPKVFQMFVVGCSGDVTAGKFNDGNARNRPILAQRLYQGMKQAWKAAKKQPVKKLAFRNSKLDLPFSTRAQHGEKAMKKVLEDEKAPKSKRILAAMGLASLERVKSGQKIDVPCLDFGNAQVVLLPGEVFVGYQLLAQKLKPDSFVMTIGYGECWPGYVPMTQGFKDKFADVWYWVDPGSDQRIEKVLRQVLQVK